MSIRDRDYMKRPPEGDDEWSAASDSKTEEFLSRFFRKHPRFFLYVGIGIAVLVVIALVTAILVGKHR